MDVRAGLLAAALIAAAASGLWGWGQRSTLATARATVERVEDQRKRAQEDADRNLATANHLNVTLQRERESQAMLLKLQSELRTSLASRERMIEALTRENEELRNWADQPIPAIARRLRDRPAIIGADAYRKWLSGSGAMHPAGDITNPQRSVAD